MTIERAFNTMAEAAAFIEGVTFVNDSSVEVKQWVMEVNVKNPIPPVRFVVIMTDEDYAGPYDEIVDNEDGAWKRLLPGVPAEITILK
jgi:hypothetical protein